MNDIKIFRYTENGAHELAPHLAHMEKDLHKLIESNLEQFLDIRFLARELPTGRLHKGQIDSLGLDADNCPVIIEYKKRSNENVISQGLFYLDWLLDHKGGFLQLCQEKLGLEVSALVEFGGARVICVASDFSKYDERAIHQIDRNMELIRYKFFGDDLLLLEMANNCKKPYLLSGESSFREDAGDAAMPLSMRMRLNNMSAGIEELYLDLLTFAETLGEDVSIRFLKHYIALARFKNFTSIQPTKTSLKLYLNLDPAEIPLEEGFSRNVSGIGHHATGNLELDLRDKEDLERAKPLIEAAYKEN